MKKNEFEKIFEKKYQEDLEYLYERWKSEGQYEDIKSYLKWFKERISENVNVKAISSNPFEIFVECIDGILGFEVDEETINVYDVILEVVEVVKR